MGWGPKQLPSGPCVGTGQFSTDSPASVNSWVTDRSGLDHFGTEMTGSWCSPDTKRAPQFTQEIKAGRGKPVCPVNGKQTDWRASQQHPALAVYKCRRHTVLTHGVRDLPNPLLQHWHFLVKQTGNEHDDLKY